MNISGSFKNPNLNKTPKETVETTVSTEPEPTTFSSFSSKRENAEIREMMELMEDLRLEDPEQFSFVITMTKEILDLISSDSIQNKNDITKLDGLISQIEKINPKFIYYIAHKSIRTAAITYKNIHVLHYFIIKKGYQLTNKEIYSNFINEYIKTLKEVDFLNEKNDVIFKYVTILQFLIEKGNCDLNDCKNDPMGNTPLHYAIAYRQLQFVIVLINEKNIDLNIINCNGNTPLDFAVEDFSVGKEMEINEQFVKLLRAKGAETNEMTDVFNEYFEENKK